MEFCTFSTEPTITTTNILEEKKMEINIVQEKLAKALSIVSKVAAGAKAQLPILNNVLIRVDDGKVSLTTTNLDMAVVSYLPVQNSQNGVVTVPAKLIAEFISNLPRGEMVKLSANGEKVVAEAKGFRSVINGALADDFPELPEIDESKMVKIQISVDDFKAGLSQVVGAASVDTTRPALTGVYFNTYEGSLYLAATDGYRLAERKLAERVETEVKAIVPVSSLKEVLSSIGEDVDEIEILLDETQVRFNLGEVEITSKLIDGSFPDYRQLIPKESDITVELDKSEMVRVTKLAALFAKEVGGSIVCETKVEEEVFVVAAIANEFGENSSEMKVKANEDGKVTLNSRFLLDAVNALDGKKLSFGFANRLDPVVLKGLDGEKVIENYVHIVMPLKS